MRLLSYFYWTAKSQRTWAKLPQDSHSGDREQPSEGGEGSGQGGGENSPGRGTRVGQGATKDEGACSSMYRP